MSLAPSSMELLARARFDLRMGVPVAVQGALLAAVETCTAERFAALRAMGSLEVALTDWRARTLKARIYDGDVARVKLPDSAGLDWVKALADPVRDLDTPMKGPFTMQRGGDAAAARAGIALCKAARLLPAVLVVPLQNAGSIAQQEGLTVIDAALTADDRLQALMPIARARLPMSVSEVGKVHVFRPGDGSEEHYAVEIGTPDRAAPVLSRLHSACFTGDVLGSLKCDCGPQLHAALEQMGEERAGVLLYLNQEGRGIGLANKMRAYALQDQGFDTVEANHRLGFEDDERDFRIGAHILRQMGFSSVRLLTNNPNKVARMESSGLTVTDRVPLKVGKNPINATYLATKAAKSGHLL